MRLDAGDAGPAREPVLAELGDLLLQEGAVLLQALLVDVLLDAELLGALRGTRLLELPRQVGVRRASVPLRLLELARRSNG